MSTPEPTPPATKPPNSTTYEISRQTGPISGVSGNNAWEIVGSINTHRGGEHAIRQWVELQGEEFTGGTLRAIPTSRITERDVTIETTRRLTLDTP